MSERHGARLRSHDNVVLSCTSENPRSYLCYLFKGGFSEIPLLVHAYNLKGTPLLNFMPVRTLIPI